MGESTKYRLSTGRVLEWKYRHELEDNVVQATSALYAFVGLNASSILEVTNALITTHNIIIEL
jgi:hypothetical protein